MQTTWWLRAQYCYILAMFVHSFHTFLQCVCAACSHLCHVDTPHEAVFEASTDQVFPRKAYSSFIVFWLVDEGIIHIETAKINLGLVMKLLPFLFAIWTLNTWTHPKEKRQQSIFCQLAVLVMLAGPIFSPNKFIFAVIIFIKCIQWSLYKTVTLGTRPTGCYTKVACL